MKTTHCTDCNVKLRSKHHAPASLYPGTRERFGNRCKTCHIKSRPPKEHVGEFVITECATCKRPTRDRRDTAHPDVLVRNGNRCFKCCKQTHKPDSDLRHAKAGLDSWLADRRKRLGATA
jgi:hypothetical protein